MFILEMSDINKIGFFGRTNFLCNFSMRLVEIVSLFLLVKSSRYEVQEVLKNDCHVLLYRDYEQIGHISYAFHKEINKRSLI